MSVDYALRQGATHLWLISLAALETQAEILDAILDPQERSAASRMHLMRDRCERVVSRALLRLLAGAYCGKRPESLEVRTTPPGKPYLMPSPGERPLKFNLSHSRGLALYAFSLEEVGVDLEHIDRGIDFRPIGRQVFSPAELDALERTPERARELFYVFWTAKEACIKATGTGLTEKLVNLDISRFEYGPLVIGPELTSGLRACSLYPIGIDDSYRAALAVAGAPAPRTLRLLRTDPSRLALGAAWRDVFSERTALANVLDSAVVEDRSIEFRP